MRCLSRICLGLLGLALAIPTAVSADPPAAKKTKTKPKTVSNRREHLCAHCQWSDMKAKGINVPPPPPMPQGGRTVPGTECTRCGNATSTYDVPPMTSSYAPYPPSTSRMTTVTPASSMDVPPPPFATMPTGPSASNMVAPTGTCVACEASEPGHAVAGGGAPGYAMVSGSMPTAEPMPIGVIQGRYAYQNPNPNPGPAMDPMSAMHMAGGSPAGAMPGAGARMPGSADPSVMPSNYSTDTITAGRSGRPHILSHLFGLDGLGRHRREENERRERETHASISYQPQNQQPVVELPASMVYGR